MNSQYLIDANIQALREGDELLLTLDSEQYGSGLKPAFQATIGAHYRHLIEHYRCLFSQITKGVFCYDKRERDEQLESDREYALRSIADTIAQLEALELEVFDQQYHIIDHLLAVPLATTLERELLFLQSHTAHHYAIIAAMARGLGKQPMREFGVAIATMKHTDMMRERDNVAATQETQEASTSDRSNACAQ
ncbi:MAG: putative damage-inducible protein DinB [Arenicella sp.]|jgi:uncharacterized damage-inducible protein DinB